MAKAIKKIGKVSAKSGKVIKPQNIKGVNKFYVEAKQKALAQANTNIQAGHPAKVVKGHREYVKTIKVPVKGEKNKYHNIQVTRRVATFTVVPANVSRFIQPRGIK